MTGGFGPTGTLVRTRLRMLVNGALRGTAEQRMASVGVVLLAVLAATVLGRIAALALDASDPSPDDLAPVAAGGLGMLAGFTLVTSVPFAISSLFVARDLDALHVTPIQPRALLLARLCDQLGTGLAIGGVLGGPPLAVYLLRQGSLEWLPWIGLVALSMAALPLAAGTAFTIAAVRVVPARRVRDAGGALVSLGIVAVTCVNLLLRGPEGVTRVPAALDPGRGASTAASAWLPTGWAARSVVAAARGDVVGALGWGLPLLLAGPLALLLLALVAERAYASGFRRGQEAGAGRHRRARSADAGGRGQRPAWLVVAAKDARVLSRDPAQLGQLLLPLALFAVYLAAPTGVDGGAGGRLPTWFGTSLTASFAGLFAASGLALRSVGGEGARMAVLRATPAPARVVLAGKVAIGAAVSVAAGWLLVGVAAARGHLPAGDVPDAALRVAVALAGLSTVAVAMGSIRPRMDWTDPRRAVGLGTSIAFLATGSVYLATLFTVWALPYASAVGGPSPALADAVSVAVVGAVTVAAVAFGAARLRRLEL
jgi:ABC-2 type transport system permease protein